MIPHEPSEERALAYEEAAGLLQREINGAIQEENFKIARALEHVKSILETYAKRAREK